jgi:glucose/arabinose dehydrogenase
VTRAASLAIALLALGVAPAAAIRVPSGVHVRTVVSNVPYASNIAFDPAGGIWLTSGAGGNTPSDGVWYAPRGAHRARHVVTGLHTALGLAWHAGALYVSYITSPSNGRVSAFTRFRHGRFASKRIVVPRLKIGRHTVDSIAPGPDGRIYVGVGSVDDHSGYPGRVISFLPGGKGLRREAVGLRNPFGLAFVPRTSRLLVTDNGRDDLGPFRPPEELNVFDVDATPIPDFGFPHCFGQGGPSCRGKRSPLLGFPAHASTDGLAITTDWAGGGLTAFVTENGSSYPANPTGRDVRIIRLGPGAATAKESRFASGFRATDPLGAAIGPDGALYVTLLISGKVLRFSEPK